MWMVFIKNGMATNSMGYVSLIFACFKTARIVDIVLRKDEGRVIAAARTS